jgi:hypothetical protein
MRSDYTAALRTYRDAADIAVLEPGLMPHSLRREVAHSNVTGDAVSTQVERVMRECERQLHYGPLSDTLRSAVPVWVPSALQQDEMKAIMGSRSR